MTHASWLGQFAGALGVSIAIWLQAITPRHIPARYTAGFFLLGCAMFMLHTKKVWFMEATMINAIGVFIIIGLELFYANIVYKKYKGNDVGVLEEVTQ